MRDTIIPRNSIKPSISIKPEEESKESTYSYESEPDEKISVNEKSIQSSDHSMLQDDA